MTIRIEEISEHHFDELVEMFNEYRMFYRKESDAAGAKKFLSERIRQSESVIYIAVAENNRAVGFIQLYPLFSSTRMKKWWLLNDLFVKPEWRDKGIGKLLIERCKALAMQTKAGGLSLETEQNNLAGNHLYPQCGFELDTSHNFYSWENPMD